MTSRIWMLVCLLTLSSAILAGQPKPLSQQVTIYRDAYGTPHVFGRTDVSTVFGFAYAQAEDNFPRMEENFILALGRASEVFGEDFLEDDRLNRTLEIEGRAREDYQQGSPKLHELCAAFADGVNYYLSRHPDVKPRLLTKIEPWYPQALMRYSYYQEGFAHDPKLEKAGLRSTVTSLIHDRNGSNGWVIAPSRSANGHAKLFINPHLPFFGPAQVYEGHVHSDEGWEFSGCARFGFLFPYIGYNASLAGCGKSKVGSWQERDGRIELFHARSRSSAVGNVQLFVA